jgi:coproporphyrinogen III oxidase
MTMTKPAESSTDTRAFPSDFALMVQSFVERLQNQICTTLEEVDGQSHFIEDMWKHKGGGGGRTRVLEEGAVFEKAGVNTSAVHGMMPEKMAKQLNTRPMAFFATGISLVIHPRSPMIPTVHANYRYFEQEDGDSWFGGGSDLTPYYLYEEDVVHFHSVLKRACDRHTNESYPRFKKWCDEYFFIRHRGETRGVGGIFYDYLRGDSERHFEFMQAAGSAFIESYVPIVKRRMNEPWADRERRWQSVRRGRYVEFNLVYDRGTTFGLETGGRTESVLMSLPPHAEWPYDFRPEPESRESRLMDVLIHPRDWAR